MATGTTIKIKRKAGALVNGELAEGELGLDTVNDDVYASTDGTTVFLVNAGGGGASTATEIAEGVVELATLAEAQGGTENGAKAVRPSGLPMRKVGTAWIGGDMTGNARGTEALDIQSARSAVTQVASGNYSSAVGSYNTASVFGSSAFGYGNTASNNSSSAIGIYNTASEDASFAAGYNNTASGYGSFAVGSYNTASAASSSAFGYNNTASGWSSSAVGFGNTASGNYSYAFGYRVKTTIANTVEVGCWSSSGTVRSTAVRMHPNGQIAMTIEDSATAPTDGGATLGSEADGTLARGMFAIQKNGTAVTLYYNNAGTIQSLSLGTLA